MTTVTVEAERTTTLRWWREVLYILAFYGVYSAVRNTQGSAAVSARHAFNNAKHIIRWEQLLGIFHEQTIQHWFLDDRGFIRFWNVYYGTAHFVVTAVALIWLFRCMPERYSRWRNTLAWTTGLALVGFALYPLMPPRLLHEMTTRYRFVDTLQAIGGLWSFDSGAMAKVSNQYAAMPSLHIGWSLWCASVIWPGVKRWWARAIVVAYPFITLFCIVVTANHFVLDAVGGVIVFSAGYGMAMLTGRYLLRTGVPVPAESERTRSGNHAIAARTPGRDRAERP